MTTRMKNFKLVICAATAFAAAAAKAGADMSFADCKMLVQFDKCDLADVGCARLLADAKRAKADGVQIERCIFYPDGEKRTKELKTLADESP